MNFLNNQNEISAIRSSRLHQTMNAVLKAHPFYQEKLLKLKFSAEDFQSIDDLEKLPVTSKEEYISNPEAFCLNTRELPNNCSVEERIIWDIAYTSGTTGGNPSPFYNTTHDMYGILDQARRCNIVEGLVASDRIANLYPVAAYPTGAFLSVIRSGLIGGQPVISGMTGASKSEYKVRNSTAEAIGIIEPTRPTVFWGVPSFISRFLSQANKLGADFSDVRLVVTSGEPVSHNMKNEWRSQLQELGAKNITFRARYAFTEMQGGLVQCDEESNPQNITPDLYFLETVNPDTGDRIPFGEEGYLAITHLHRRGTVMLRYIVGDIVRLSLDPCPFSGRLGERVIETPRRTGNLVKCRGMLVNTDIVIDYLSAINGIGNYQIQFCSGAANNAMEEMILRLELKNTGSIEKQIVEDITRAVFVRPRIKFYSVGTLYDETKSIKLKTVIDTRIK